MLSAIEARGNREWTRTAVMLFSLETLVSALLLSTVVFGAAAGSVEDFQKRPQSKGIDISSYQGDVNWGKLVTDGVSFVYIGDQ